MVREPARNPSSVLKTYFCLALLWQVRLALYTRRTFLSIELRHFMNDVDRILARLPPGPPDARLRHVDQLVWRKVEQLRHKRGRMLLCSCVVAGTFLVGVTIGHFAGKSYFLDASTDSSRGAMLLSERV
jgi:hypothetical protein